MFDDPFPVDEEITADVEMVKHKNFVGDGLSRNRHIASKGFSTVICLSDDRARATEHF